MARSSSQAADDDADGVSVARQLQVGGYAAALLVVALVVTGQIEQVGRAAVVVVVALVIATLAGGRTPAGRSSRAEADIKKEYDGKIRLMERQHAARLAQLEAEIPARIEAGIEAEVRERFTIGGDPLIESLIDRELAGRIRWRTDVNLERVIQEEVTRRLGLDDD